MIALASRFKDELADLVVAASSRVSDLSGRQRRVAGRLAPRDVADVVRIVRSAGRHGVKLQPVSCGRNWGFGSALPPEDGVWVVDLSGLDHAADYEGETGSIGIGPGVTQIALYRTLAQHGGDWFFNVTGAGHSTSVLGNALERGIGYHGQRHLDLLELQIVTGTGEIVNSRLGLEPERLGLACVGTDLTQLFAQGTFGIVVSARLRLIKKTDGGGAVIVRLREQAQAARFFHAILGLKRDGCIQGVPHIANRERIVTTMAPWLEPDQVPLFSQRAACWTAALPITGGREMTEAAFGIIRARLEDFCEVETIPASREIVDDSAPASPLRQLQQLASGYPSNLALPGVEWSALGESNRTTLDPEQTEAGLIHVTPAVAASVPAIEAALGLIRDAARELELGNLPITVNVADLQTAVLVISISFPRSHASAARKKARRLEARLRQTGIRPYRIGLGQEKWLGRAPAAASAVFENLRAALDPLGVFARSKYAAPYGLVSKSKNRRRAAGRAPLEVA